MRKSENNQVSQSLQDAEKGRKQVEIIIIGEAGTLFSTEEEKHMSRGAAEFVVGVVAGSRGIPT